MLQINRLFSFTLISFMLFSCGSSNGQQTAKDTTNTNIVPQPDTQQLPQPYATKSSVKFSNVIGWKDGKMPTVPQGFTVTKLADGLDNPRWIYVAPNGDILVAESNTEPKGF